jgi:hypothetical protein
MSSKFRNLLIGLLCAGFAVYFLWILGEGLATGEIAKLTKSGQGVVLRAQDPEPYWLQVGFWCIGAGLFLLTAIKKLLAACR